MKSVIVATLLFATTAYASDGLPLEKERIAEFRSMQLRNGFTDDVVKGAEDVWFGTKVSKMCGEKYLSKRELNDLIITISDKVRVPPETLMMRYKELAEYVGPSDDTKEEFCPRLKKRR